MTARSAQYDNLSLPPSTDDGLKDSIAQGPAIETGRGISQGNNPAFNPRGATCGS